MKLRDHLRDWLGIYELPSVEMYKAMELSHRERHKEILTALNLINQQLQVQHIGNKHKVVKAPPSWESIEAEALRKIEAEQAKEPN